MNLNDLRKNAYANNDEKIFSGVNNEIDKILLSQQKQQKQQKQNKKKQAENKFIMQNENVSAGFVPMQASGAGRSQAHEDAVQNGGMLKVPAEKESVYRRVAKFLLIIGVDEAAKILPHLPESQTEKIVPEIASIRNISPEESEAILAEFHGLLEQARASGGVGAAREILQKAYGDEKAEKFIENAVPYPDGKPFDYLADADAERILQLLSDESDEVRALVLSRLEPKKAASVINLMNSADKSSIVLRLAKMQAVLPEVIKRVDKAMHEKSLAQTSEKAESIDGRNALAEILKKMPESAENEILGALSYADAELTEDLRSRLFTIDDVQNADDRFIQNKLREMTDNDIAYLIAAKPDDFRKKIFKNVSKGRADVILEQEYILKPMRRSDCERVTSQFFSELRRAYEEGKLRIKGRDEEEYVN